MADDIALSCAVTRTELALSPLDVDAGPYELVRPGGLNPGKTVWRRNTVMSPYVHGSTLVHAVKDQGTLDLQIRCKAASDSALWVAIDTAVEAFEQTSYTVTVTIDGETRTYLCDPADWSLSNDGEIDTLLIMDHRQLLTISAPRYPLAEEEQGS